MKFLIGLLFILNISLSAHARESNEAFLVTVKDQSIEVVSPASKKDVVTLVVTNQTFDKIISEIRSGSKTIKRFVLEPSGAKGAVFSLTVKVEKGKTLNYVSIAPPFQETPLIFSKEKYEIP